jgi:ATP-binding cassette subfamily B protein
MRIMSSYRTLRPYFRRHALTLTLGLSALIIVDLLQLLIPRVVKQAVDQLSILQATPGSLAWAGLSIVGLAALIGVFRYVWRSLLLGFSRVVERDLRDRLFAKLLSLSPSWFMTRTTGDIMAHATNDLEAIRMAAGFGLVALVDAVLLSAASVAFMIWIDPVLTLLALIPMPVIPFLTRHLGLIMHRRYREVQETFGRLTGAIREYLSGIRVVKAHVREAMVLEDMDQVGLDYVKKNIRLNMVSGAFFPLMTMFTNLATAIVIYYGGRMTIFSGITPGDFVAFLSYLGLLTWPMMALGWVTNLVQRGAASLDRINNVLDRQPDITDPPTPARPDHFRGELVIRHLTFTYPGRSTPVVKNINLNCPAGSITALVGRTGSGKSTLLNLIPRLLATPPQTIFLDGLAVENMELDILRSAIGYVPQDGYIFSGTIAENVAYGRPEADLPTIRAAARAADFDDEVMSFHDGYDTYVGERGVTLSGGQKQRLALARALLIDPPLLILDDTLSAVDAGAEKKILANLSRLRLGKTTIISSHRLTSLKIAALIHVLENGSITESGTINELLATDGYFATMYQLQQAQMDT